MIFKTGSFYRTTENHFLFASDHIEPSTRGKMMAEIPTGSLIMYIKQGKWRYISVIYQDMIGWVWLPTNRSTHMLFDSVKTSEEE